MSATVLYHSIFYKHKPPHYVYHPENPERLNIALSGIKANGLEMYIRSADCPEGRYQQYKSRIHHEDYVAMIERFCDMGDGFIDSDTYVCRDTCIVANHALCLSVHAMELALDTKEGLVFALVRPPGHHVGLSGKAMGAPTQGFCIFNNIAIAIVHAIERGCRPVTIIDVDVHHGNGTQEIFWENPNVIHIDIHEHGLYPGTGYMDDLGGGEGYGTKINIPMPSFSSDSDYIYVFKELVLPVIYSIKPRVLAISAGFDAYRDDGLASIELTDSFYKFFGSTIRLLAKELGIGVVAILEGGYSVGLEKGLPTFMKSFIKPIDIDIELVEASGKVVYNVKRLRSIIKEFYEL